MNEIEKYYNKFLNYGFSSLIDEYCDLCITLGRDVEVISPCEKYTAKAVGIDSDGKLLVKRGEITEAIASGEVSVRGLLGYI